MKLFWAEVCARKVMRRGSAQAAHPPHLGIHAAAMLAHIHGVKPDNTV
jgi:hypothetical protein